MKLHASVGADILSAIDFPYPVVPIVRHHHENWDGTGYPERLRGTDIPIGARILSVVDCFDALTSDRPYRPRLSDEEAVRILLDRRGRCTILDRRYLYQGQRLRKRPDRSQTPPITMALVLSRVCKVVRHPSNRQDWTRSRPVLTKCRTLYELARATAGNVIPRMQPIELQIISDV